MERPEQSPTYGPYAEIYDRLWGPKLVSMAVPPLEQLLLRHLPEGAKLLDLCCGTGQITQSLGARGFRVTGIDVCEEMLARARANAPSCRFLRHDARRFDLPPVHHGVLSTSGSLNHIASLEDLAAVFANVHRALRPGGTFVFDVLLGDRYQPDPEVVSATVEEDYVVLVREGFDAGEHRSHGEMTLFYRQDGWQRWETAWDERFHLAAELETILAAAGFTEIRFYDRAKDLGLDDSWNRTYVVARKPEA